MTQQELWSAYCARNPSFDGDGEVTMKASGLKKLFDQTWRIAYEAGETEERKRQPNLTGGADSDLFEQMFGKFKK